MRKTKTMVNGRQSDREGSGYMDAGVRRAVGLACGQQQVRGRRCVMKLKILRDSAAALLLLGLFVSYNGPAQALPPDHRSPDGTCQGVPEPPTPQGTACEVKLCTNNGDWMCCNKCTAAGGYCCNQMNALTRSQSGGMRVPGGRLQMAPGTITSPSTPKFPQTGTTTAPIMRRGVEGEQGAEPESGTEKSAPGQSEEKK